MNFAKMYESFSSRLIILTAIPLLGFLVAMGILITNTAQNSIIMNQLTSLPEFSTAASGLVHELQKERGYSAGFIGSGGKKFAQELIVQRKQTDGKLGTFQTFLKSNPDLHWNEHAKKDLQLAQSQLQALSASRADISAKRKLLKDTVGYYTNLNGQLLSLIGNLGSIAENTDVVRQATAMLSFMQVKERAGIVRAVLSATFSADQFAPGMQKKVIVLVTEQSVYSKIFQQNASQENIEAFNALKQTNAFRETSVMRDKALSGATSEFGIDASHWFKRQTQKINEMKQFEDSLNLSLANLTNGYAAAATSQLWQNAVMAAIVILLTLGLSTTLIRRLSTESRSMSEKLVNVANGHLSVDKPEYESPQFEALHSMQGKLIEVNSAIQEVSSTVSDSSQEIAQSNNSLAERAQEQADNLEKTASGMEEITTTIMQNTENLKHGDHLSANARDHAVKGQKVVTDAIHAMDDIKTASGKIAEITNLINDIAFQTNLLALNAAVEAARAGEQGRGFAVVASEVRNLAQKSASAASEINTLIDATVEQINTGSELVNTSGESLTKIVEAITSVTEVISEISTAGEQQSQGISMINAAISRLDSTNQENTVMVEEVAVTSKILEDQAENLQHLISFYKISSGSRATSTQSTVDRRTGSRPWSKTNASESVEHVNHDDAWEAHG